MVEIIGDAVKDVKSFGTKVGLFFHKAGFWFLILVLVGVVLGGWGMTIYHRAQMDEAVLLQGLVYDKKVFDLKERVR